MKSKDLFNKKSECCGCWGCANICPKGAISMQQDNEGFLYPSIDEKVCINCGLCIKVCPVNTATERKNNIKKQPHISLVSLNLTHDFCAVISSAVLENYLRQICPTDYIINTINYNYPVERKNNGFKKISLCRDDDIYRKQRFYIFRDQFINRVDTIKGFDDVDFGINYKAFISGYEFDSIPKNLDETRNKAYKLDFDTDAKKLIINQEELGAVLYLADESFFEEMVSTAKVEQNKDNYLFVYLENPNRDIIKQINEYAKNNELVIYYCSDYECEFDVKTKCCYTDGPAEFLYRIKNAEYVITDAEFCMRLSKIMHKTLVLYDLIKEHTDINELTVTIKDNCFIIGEVYD